MTFDESTAQDIAQQIRLLVEAIIIDADYPVPGQTGPRVTDHCWKLANLLMGKTPEGVWKP
jgi:hypothetical protein